MQIIPLPKGPNPSGKTFTTKRDYEYSNTLNYVNNGVFINSLGMKYSDDFCDLYALYNKRNATFFNSGVFKNNRRIWNQLDSQFINQGEMTNHCLITNGGWFDNYGTMHNGSQFVLFNEFNNYGKFINGPWYKDKRQLATSSLGGVFTNHKGATLINSHGSMSSSEIFLDAQYNNPLPSCLNNLGMFTNNGSLRTGGAKGFINGSTGTYNGNGSIHGGWTDHGKVRPGLSAGSLLIDGDYHKLGGTKYIELGGENESENISSQNKIKHDFIEVSGDMIIDGGMLEVSLINDFEIGRGQSFLITKVNGELIGKYENINEGDSIGLFKSVYGTDLDLFLTYEGGDGNDITLFTEPKTNADLIFGNHF